LFWLVSVSGIYGNPLIRCQLGKFFFFLLVESVFPFGGVCFTLPMDITLIFEALRGLLCANGVSAWLSTLYIFFSFSEYVCYVYMSFHVFFLCCIWFWVLPFQSMSYYV
jgi:hypothetical protein